MKKSKIIILATVLTVLAGYGAGFYYYQDKFTPGTYLNGKDISNLSLDQAKYPKTIDQEFKIDTGDKKHILNTKDIDLQIDSKEELVINNQPQLWFLGLIEKKDYTAELETKYSEEKLKSYIETEFKDYTVETKDAQIKLENKDYIIEAEVQGNYIDKDKLKNEIIDLLKAESYELDLSDTFPKPNITKDDPKLKEELETLKELASRRLTLDYGSFKEELPIDKLVAAYDSTNKNYDKEKIKALIQGLAEKYDTVYTERKHKSLINGDVIIPPGIYGWELDVEKTTGAALEALNNKQTEIKPIHSREATYRNADGSDLGPNYIEVSLNDQRMLYVENGEILVDTPVVTGNPNTGAATPPGTNEIWSKERDKVLEGIDPFGANYTAPVTYWMCVDWSHVGIHNARWRENAGGFGGNIYRENGSYGCINTPFDAMGKLFELVPIGTPVLVY